MHEFYFIVHDACSQTKRTFHAYFSLVHLHWVFTFNGMLSHQLEATLFWLFEYRYSSSVLMANSSKMFFSVV
jgi:hypothetical protein